MQLTHLMITLVSVSSDTLGTFKFSGNGGSTASTAIDATAAGDYVG